MCAPQDFFQTVTVCFYLCRPYEMLSMYNELFLFSVLNVFILNQFYGHIRVLQKQHSFTSATPPTFIGCTRISEASEAREE
jgi:hypothetical protein